MKIITKIAESHKRIEVNLTVFVTNIFYNSNKIFVSCNQKDNVLWSMIRTQYFDNPQKIECTIILYNQLIINAENS